MPAETLRLYTACPDSTVEPPDAFARRLRRLVGWCHAAGHEAILVPSGNRQLDSWTVAQLILHEEPAVRPIVSVQPLTMHPYDVAKRVVSLWRLYGTAPDLNLMACDSRVDRLALGDSPAASRRVDRLCEFADVLRALVAGNAPVRHHGRFFHLDQPAALRPPTSGREPELFVSGSGTGATTVAEATGAVRIGPIGAGDADCLRLGMIARSEDGAAWDEAIRRFPDNHGARLADRIAEALGGTAGQERVRGRIEEAAQGPRPLWLEPFENGHAASAYVVGAYRTVATELLRHLQEGVRRFLLEPPGSQAELEHAGLVFARAWSRHASPLTVAG